MKIFIDYAKKYNRISGICLYLWYNLSQHMYFYKEGLYDFSGNPLSGAAC